MDPCTAGAPFMPGTRSKAPPPGAMAKAPPPNSTEEFRAAWARSVGAPAGPPAPCALRERSSEAPDLVAAARDRGALGAEHACDSSEAPAEVLRRDQLELRGERATERLEMLIAERWGSAPKGLRCESDWAALRFRLASDCVPIRIRFDADSIWARLRFDSDSIPIGLRFDSADSIPIRLRIRSDSTPIRFRF